jgi:hypothetical protein
MNILRNKKYLIFGVWLILCLGCFVGLNWYKMQPGPVGKLLTYWPQNIEIKHDQNLYNIVMFAHPKCGCTYSSVVELEKLLRLKNKKINAKIFFYRPTGSKKDWSDGESKKLASKLEGAKVYDDEGGQIARHFGAMTSGQVMLFSPEGKLYYAGGITESRGHVGVNAGSRAIASVAETGIPSEKREHTYGCVLFSEKEMQDYKRE